MAITIQTNVSSLLAQQALSNTASKSQQTYQQLSTGYRINSAADDAAGLGISTSMNAQVVSYVQAQRNANDSISMAQTADGAASQISDIMTTMRQLAVEAANGSMSTNDRANIQTQFAQLSSEIDRIANVTTFNGTSLLSGTTSTVQFQIGINTSINDTVTLSFGGGDTTSLGINGLSVSTITGAQSAMTLMDAGIQKMSIVRDVFGSAMNRMQSAISNLQTITTNLSAALSRIRDVDVASASADMSRNSVLTQAGVSVLAQANASQQSALKLLS